MLAPWMAVARPGTMPVGVAVGTGVGVGVRVPVTATVAVGEGIRVGVSVGDVINVGVAVGVGDGVVAILRSMGVHAVVSGGQSMNPSTADLIAAVEAVPADQVVILPNNKNIIPVAEQVDGQTDRPVRVVPTRGVAEGIACLMAYDPQASAEANAVAMTELAADVVAGEVTQAVRESTSEAGPIVEGDWLGICRDGIVAVETTMSAAATALIGVIVDDDHELLTVIAGADADPDTTEALETWVQEHHPDVEVEVHDGGQPLYPYYFGLE